MQELFEKEVRAASHNYSTPLLTAQASETNPTQRWGVQPTERE